MEWAGVITAPFLAYGWESVCCWEGDHDPNFHSAQDNLSNVNISYLVNTTRIIAATLAYLADLSRNTSASTDHLTTCRFSL